MKLHQICGKVSDEARDRMSIILDHKKFKYGSEDYIQNQEAEIEEYDLSEDFNYRTWRLTAKTKLP